MRKLMIDAENSFDTCNLHAREMHFNDVWETYKSVSRQFEFNKCYDDESFVKLTY